MIYLRGVRLHLLPLPVVLGLALVSGSAQASTLSATSDTITYQAAPGETNRVTVNWGGGRPTFDDSPEIENAMTIGPGCQDTYGDRGIIECPGASPSAKIVIKLGDGDDRAAILGDAQRGHRHEIYGEAGNDQLLSEEGSDLLDGGDGNDELQPDDMDSGGQAGTGDEVVGGPGVDKLQLVDSPQDQLAASLDDVANDGGPGEGDNYHSDVENIQGARGAQNTLVGTAGPNTIEIISDDRVPNAISGGGGDDRLLGGAGSDTLDGGDGNDVLVGGAWDDRLIGGPGVDSFDGDGDTLYPGNDRIEARDGVAESINCGIGADTAIIDANDTVPSDGGSICEVVDWATAAPPSGGGVPTTPGSVAVRSTKLSYHDGRVALVLRCAAGTVRCSGTVRVRTASKVKLGSRRSIVSLLSVRYSIAAGRSATVRAKPTSKGRSLLRRTKAVRVKVTVDPSGAVAATTKSLTLRRR